MFAEQKGYTLSSKDPAVMGLLVRMTEIGIQAEIANLTALKINRMIAANQEAGHWDFVEYFTPENVNLLPAMNHVVSQINQPGGPFTAEIIENVTAGSAQESCKLVLRIKRNSTNLRVAELPRVDAMENVSKD